MAESAVWQVSLLFPIPMSTDFLDRLLHHSVVINIRGNSYRLRGKDGKEGVETSQS